jgi:Family of unknown function (DUF5362)
MVRDFILLSADKRPRPTGTVSQGHFYPHGMNQPNRCFTDERGRGVTNSPRSPATPRLPIPAEKGVSSLLMDNPYQASSHSAYPTSSGSVTPATLQALAGTKPWVRLCSIMGFIGAGFMILAGLAMMTSGAMVGMSSQQSAGLAGLPMIMGIVYIAMSLLYLFPSLKLWQYGSAIVRLMSSNSTSDLEAALDQQRGFWKFVGIMMIIMIAISLLAMVGGILAGIAGAARMSH